MIPPKLPIRISGEAGKRLGPQRISLELVGGTDATLILRSLDVDVAQWNQRNGPTVPEDDELVSLWDADDRRIFMGRAQSRFVWGKGGSYYQVSIMGPYEFLKKAELLAPNTDPSGSTAIRALKTFPRGDLRASVLELLTMAVDQGAEFRIGEVSPSFAVPQMTFKANSFHDALTDMNRWPSDVMSRVRYDVDSLPLLDVLRRSDAVTQTIQLQSGTNLCTEIMMEAQPDLIPSSVSVQYVTRDPVTYKPTYTTVTAGTPSGPSYKRQNVTISGPENDSYLPSESYPSVTVQTVTPSTSSSALLDWIKVADPFIASLYERYGPNWFGPFAVLEGFSTFNIANGETLQWATTSGGVLSGSKVTRVPRMVDNQGNALTSGWYAVRSTDQIPDWFTSQLGIQTRQGTFYADAVVAMEWPDDEPQPTDDYPGVAEFASKSYWSQQNVFYADMHRSYFIMEVAMPVTFIDISYAVATQIWKPAEYEFLEPPPGLADNLYRAQQWLPYEGRALFAPKAQNVAGPGEVVSVTGDVPPLWPTANALVKQVEWDLRVGSSRVDIGFPLRTDATALLDKFRRSASDNIEQNE
jgi:hypothetical protein